MYIILGLSGMGLSGMGLSGISPFWYGPFRFWAFLTLIRINTEMEILRRNGNSTAK